MQHFIVYARDASGNIVVAPTVHVMLQADDSTATIYSDNSATPKANPFTGGADGLVDFYGDVGRYKVNILSSSGAEVTLEDVSLLEPAEGLPGDPSNATHLADSKTTPVDADEVPLVDSASSYTLKKLTWANLKATLKTYFDTLYQPLRTALTALGALTPAANKIPYFTNGTTAALLTLDTDGTLAGNSDTSIPTQKAVKTYADALIAANDAMVFKGVIDCSANPNYPAADRGHTYRVSVAGKIGGGSGVNVEVGDILLCLTDGTASGNQATVGTAWSIIQVNIDGALTTASIGVTVQAYAAALLTIAGLSPTNDDVMQYKAGAWANRTIAQLRSDLQGTGLTAAASGFRGIPQNSQSAAYTTVAADAGKQIFHPSADTTARTWTIDSNANVAYPVETAITFINQNGAGVITIAITSDTMRLAGAGTTGNRTLAANGIATAVKVTSTEWIISGVGLT